MNDNITELSTSNDFPPYVEFSDLPNTNTPIDATNLNNLQSLMRQDIQDNQSIPVGGTTGQVLKKVSNTDYDIEWSNETSQIINSIEGTSTTLAPSQNSVNTAINDIKNDRAFIVGYLSSSQDIWNANNIRVNINASITEGDYFQLDSENHQITVLKDCIAILSGGIFVDGSEGDGYVWGRIRVSGTTKTSHLERIINHDFTNVGIPTTAVKLNQNDTITLELDYTSTSGNPSLRSGDAITFLSVAKL